MTANVDLGGQLVPLLPVLDIDVKTAPDSAAASAEKATTAGRLLTLLSVWAPLVLLVAGLLALVAVLLRRRPNTAH